MTPEQLQSRALISLSNPCNQWCLAHEEQHIAEQVFDFEYYGREFKEHEKSVTYSSDDQSDTHTLRRTLATVFTHYKPALPMLALRFVFFSILLYTQFFPHIHIAAQVPAHLYDGMKYRCIGPFRGGRSLACTGVAGDRKTYYFGATGGGIWRTTDAGESWNPISDNTFVASSIGAIAIAPSDANVLYAGTGECDIRGNISFGDGMYKTTDAGATWKRAGLQESFAICKISIHPANPDEVLAACMGRIFGTGGERGIYKTTDGGTTWKNVLKRSGTLGDSTGAIDIQRDPHNPRILYAALWQAYRNAYSMSSGGKGCGLFKSTDGGDTWTEISTNTGLPKGMIGKIRIACSPAQRNRLWAMIENENGGLFRSDDAGKTWQRTCDEKSIRQRPWYFSHITADPKNPDVIYALNVGFHKSTDGGRSFKGIGTMHGDHHDMWIDPADPERFILADDGGATVTNTGGDSFTQLDIPTAQFYHVTTDNHIPYRVYGCQQDNSSVGIASRTTGWSIDERDWFVAAGGESGYIAIDPKDENIIYGGNYGGFLSKLNRTTTQDQDVSVYPDNVVGSGATNHVYRFQWTFPIVFSKHDSSTLYACGNHVFRTTNAGYAWEKISPDLTTNDSTKQQPSGGMITKDNTGVETHCTIFAFAESPLDKNILWAGSDDGLVHLSTNGGGSWTNVTPKNLPNSGKPALISIIEASRFNTGTAYIAATRYKSADDQQPYLLRTTDFGKSWVMITNGISAPSYTRVIREDTKRKGLLYCGTETGVFVSFNDGGIWQPLQLNLPHTPIHDMVIHERDDDLILATHGRSFWILDDISPLRQMTEVKADADITLYTPRPSYRIEGGSWSSPQMQTGENAPNGVMVHYSLRTRPDKAITLEFLDARDSLIIAYSSNKDAKGEPVKSENKFYPKQERMRSTGAVPADSGFNRFVWNMRYPNATESPVVMWGASTAGPRAVPGTYSVRLKLGDSVIAKQPFRIIPSVNIPPDDFRAQFELHTRINKKVSETHDAVIALRDMKTQLNTVLGRIADAVGDTTKTKDIRALAKRMDDTLTSVEEALVQTKAKAGQDLLNYPMKLGNKLAALASTVASADTRPTEQTYAAVARIESLIQRELDRYARVKERDLPAFNTAASGFALPAVRIKKKEKN